jgi:hypothetical protein
VPSGEGLATNQDGTKAHPDLLPRSPPVLAFIVAAEASAEVMLVYPFRIVPERVLPPASLTLKRRLSYAIEKLKDRRRALKVCRRRS